MVARSRDGVEGGGDPAQFRVRLLAVIGSCDAAVVGISYTCEPTLACAFLVSAGEISADDWYLDLERLVNDPNFAHVDRMLIDLPEGGDLEGFADPVIEAVSIRWNRHNDARSDQGVAVLSGAGPSTARRFGDEGSTRAALE